MAELLEFFGAARFVPRSQCGDWCIYMAVLFVASNAILFAGYMGIVASLITSHRHGILPFTTSIYRSLLAFFFLCGLMHLLDGCLSFAWPAYHLHSVLYAAQAVFVVSAVRYVAKAIVALESSTACDPVQIASEATVACCTDRLADLAQQMRSLVEAHDRG